MPCLCFVFTVQADSSGFSNAHETKRSKDGIDRRLSDGTRTRLEQHVTKDGGESGRGILRGRGYAGEVVMLHGAQDGGGGESRFVTFTTLS